MNRYRFIDMHIYTDCAYNNNVGNARAREGRAVPGTSPLTPTPSPLQPTHCRIRRSLSLLLSLSLSPSLSHAHTYTYTHTHAHTNKKGMASPCAEQRGYLLPRGGKSSREMIDPRSY